MLGSKSLSGCSFGRGVPQEVRSYEKTMRGYSLGLQAGSLIVIKSLQRKIQLLEEELCKRPTETECTKCGAHVESIERNQADTVPNIPMEYELPTLDVSQDIDMPTDVSLLQENDDLCVESCKSTVTPTAESNTL